MRQQLSLSSLNSRVLLLQCITDLECSSLLFRKETHLENPFLQGSLEYINVVFGVYFVFVLFCFFHTVQWAPAAFPREEETQYQQASPRAESCIFSSLDYPKLDLSVFPVCHPHPIFCVNTSTTLQSPTKYLTRPRGHGHLGALDYRRLAT